MKRKSILEISLWVYISLSAVCLITQFIPGIDHALICYFWYLFTNLFRLGLGIGMLYLMFTFIRLQKLKEKLRKEGGDRS